VFRALVHVLVTLPHYLQCANEARVEHDECDEGSHRSKDKVTHGLIDEKVYLVHTERSSRGSHDAIAVIAVFQEHVLSFKEPRDIVETRCDQKDGDRYLGPRQTPPLILEGHADGHVSVNGDE